MTKLRIAVVGHIRHPIARPFMGGMEAFTWQLVRHLAKRGHDVHLLASGDSVTDLPEGVALHPLLSEHYDKTYPWHEFHGTNVLNHVLDRAYRKACDILSDGKFDVVHNNSLHRFLPPHSQSAGLPMVTSLHIPPFSALQEAVDTVHWGGHISTVTSSRQKQIWWPTTVPQTARVVHNGIDLDQWPYAPGGDGSAVWSGRITPTKGTHLAIQAAEVAGVPLKICGTIEHRDYFEQSVRPYLDDSIRYLGHLTAAELAEVYADSSAFIFTPQWEEPFGLVAIEAMATGLPVAATDRGAVREIIGAAGSISESDDPRSLANALQNAMSITPNTARQRAITYFALPRMLDAFERCYAAARAGAATAAVQTPPKLNVSLSSLQGA